MPYGLSSIPHIILGFCVLVLYWTPLLTRKGGSLHRRTGTWFFASLPPIIASVVPILLFGKGRLEPASVIQILYLALCVGTVGYTGWNAIRAKNDLSLFRTRSFGILAFAMFISGCLLVVVSILTGKVLILVFSTIGITYGGFMLRFWFMKQPVQPRWWLTWHVGSTCFLFSATHGSVSAVIWKSMFGHGEGDSVQIVTQTGALIIAGLLFVWIAGRHHVPLRFGNPVNQPMPETA